MYLKGLQKDQAVRPTERDLHKQDHKGTKKFTSRETAFEIVRVQKENFFGRTMA